MASKWLNDNIFSFNLSYWIIRNEEGNGKDLCGTIKFDLGCRKLVDGKPQASVAYLATTLKRKCGLLLRNLAKKHHLNEMEILDILAHTMHDNRVDADTIESDCDMIQKMLNQEAENQRIFDKISEKV
jgi:hypothetical protein